MLNDKVAAVEGARRSMELAAADVTELSTVVVIALAYALVIAFTVPTTRAAVGVIVAVGLAVLAIEVVLAYITLRPNKVPRPAPRPGWRAQRASTQRTQALPLAGRRPSG